MGEKHTTQAQSAILQNSRSAGSALYQHPYPIGAYPPPRPLYTRSWKFMRTDQAQYQAHARADQISSISDVYARIRIVMHRLRCFTSDNLHYWKYAGVACNSAVGCGRGRRARRHQRGSLTHAHTRRSPSGPCPDPGVLSPQSPRTICSNLRNSPQVSGLEFRIQER